MKLFFILGREPMLSVTEIFGLLRRHSIDKKVSFNLATIAKNASISKEILEIEVPDSVDPKELMDELGGTIKIGQIVETLPANLSIDQLVERFKDAILQTSYLKNLTRIRFGLSIYDGEPNGSKKYDMRRFAKILNMTGIPLKRAIQNAGLAVRWVVGKEPALSSVIVETNRLLREGVEIVVIVRKDKLLFGKTIAVQPFAELEVRDYGRPGRDAKSGMLPPKLARILVNLSESSTASVLLDPFCGSGTIINEALLLGYKNIIGTDADPIAIKNANLNVEWLKNQQLLKVPTNNIKITECDIRDLTDMVKVNSVDAIITETFLGPPLRGNEPDSFIAFVRQDLAKLYREMFKSFKKVLTQNGKVVVVLPLIHQKNNFLPSPILQELESLGFKIMKILPDTLKIPQSLINEFGFQGKTLIYGRKDQKVWREIVVLKVNKQ